jgi:putative DNA primase/helicase
MPDHLSSDVIDQTPDVTPADVLDVEALLTELAGLSPIAYEQRRPSAAKLLGVRVGPLDAEVAARRWRQAAAAGAQDSGAEQAAAPLVTAVPEPWADAVDGPQLLADLSAYYARYIVLPEGAAEALALWTVHTYAVDAAQITPRLAVVSPQPRCGKATLMALLGAVTARPLSAANITASALFRAIEAWRPPC